MHWETLSQSEPSIQSRNFINRFASATTGIGKENYNSSLKVSIGHETVNITEIAGSNDRRCARQGANILSLCFMSFISVNLILIAVCTMNLLTKNDLPIAYITPYHIISNNPILTAPLQLNPSEQLSLIASSTSSNSIKLTPSSPLLSTFLIAASSEHYVRMNPIMSMIPVYYRSIRDLATAVSLLIVVFNCFCLLVFSIEIYLGCNYIKYRRGSDSSSTSRFIAICGFYASIPALILVMCLYILLSMSLIPAIISLTILGLGLILILITLISHLSRWQTRSVINTKIGVTPYKTDSQSADGELYAKTDELSTLV
ncbi:unnamed protein product [Didymodactylos carnosus]|uniref:Uncharacterized protein n=1 Tax=Didymodactylos carnosus TaxID=1234261 RepID=A0A813PKV1_9BILA|nr:unnamed protein product [Didymodactylos carnosus]CAF0954994.1 unnamed protein product [Didymodactylos carnosus]CAF3534529.1 unnamed protein product [Didymodactylos carnosus]CAF3728386.1 unnamed protein product [Didymodactylos carnosus]